MNATTTPSSTRYADWKAPTDDGELLVWPGPRDLVAQTQENRRTLADCTAPAQGVPLRELRAGARRWIGHTADDQPLVATGHQAEL
ncbi:MAG TPA: hypothetical protein VEA69_14570, partial [Tepidisphaeraceae bacterium]|nr:hypothetical protein [Tepidisphaeraceae bacterium]